MVFGKDLAKGLVRSAVNQVGRDAGKVVSNQLYGDAHSVPHRSVGSSGSGQPEFVGTDEHEVRIERCGPPSGLRISLYVFLAFLFNFAGAVALIAMGCISWLSRERVKGWRVYSVPTYHRDGRYREGMRYTGDVLRRERIMLDADEWELERNAAVARTYLFSGVAILLFLVVILCVGGQGK